MGRMESPAPLDRRERRKRQTRRALQAAAVRLFAERGFEATTIEDITDAVDVGRRTFFRYYATKEDVLLPHNPDVLDRLRAALVARPAEEPIEASLRAVMEAILGAEQYAPEEKRELILLRAELMATTPSLVARSLELQAAWEAVIAEAIAVRRGVDAATDVRSRLLAAGVVATLRVALDVWVARGGTMDLATLVAEGLDALESGFRSGSGVGGDGSDGKDPLDTP